MKPLDMADKYDPLSYQDEEPTVKVHMPNFLPKVIVDGQDCEEDMYGTRDTIPMPPSYPDSHFQEKRYPGVGLLLCLGTGLAFWGTVAWLLFR